MVMNGGGEGLCVRTRVCTLSMAGTLTRKSSFSQRTQAYNTRSATRHN
jgi:hypothetical protein